MAIDILSSRGAKPIIVGDETDIEYVIGVSRDSHNNHQILLNSENWDTQTIDCSAQFNDNVAAQVDVIIVAMDRGDSIKSAYTMPISIERNDTILSKVRISEAHLRGIAEQIVSGKFMIDSLRIRRNILNEAGNDRGIERAESLLANETRASAGERKLPEPN